MALDLFTPNARDTLFDPTSGQLTEIGRRLIRTLSLAVSGLPPTTARYWLSTSDPVLSAEQNLGALASGYLKLTTAIGIGTPSTVAAVPQADVTGLVAALAAKATLPIAEADVTGLVAALALLAPLASPTFTGVPAGPTAGAATNTTQLATTAMVQAAIAALGAGVVGSVQGSAFHNTTQVLTTGVFTPLNFNSEDFQVGTLHSTSVNNSRVTIATTGTYQFIATVSFAANATGQRILVGKVNSTTFFDKLDFPTNAVAGQVFVAQLVKLIPLTAGNYVEIFAYQDSGGNLNVGDTTNRYAQCAVSWIRLT